MLVLDGELIDFSLLLSTVDTIKNGHGEWAAQMTVVRTHDSVNYFNCAFAFVFHLKIRQQTTESRSIAEAQRIDFHTTQ